MKSLLRISPLSQMSRTIAYGIHNFVAEEDDEISFKAGEPIILLELDEVYGDGWWKVHVF
jgi:hypothetical protein